MNSYNLVNIVLGVVAAIALVVCIVLKSTFLAGAVATSGAVVTSGSEVYDSAVSVVSSANLDSQEAQAQNGQFESYFGTNVSAIEVKQLISLVKQNNSNPVDSEKPSTILVELNGNAITDASSIDSSKKYTVEALNDSVDDSDPTSSGAKSAGYYSSGFIRTISISEN